MAWCAAGRLMVVSRPWSVVCRRKRYNIRMFAFLRPAWLPLFLAALVGLWIVLEQSSEEKPGVVTIRWVVNSQERDRAFYEPIQKGFEAKYPHIHIEFIKTNEGNK